MAVETSILGLGTKECSSVCQTSLPALVGGGSEYETLSIGEESYVYQEG